MSEAPAAAVQLARKEKKQTQGRRGYSEELKAAVREAAKEETKTAIANATGISYPTVNKSVGKMWRKKTARKTKRTAKKAGRRRKRAPRKAAGSYCQILCTETSGGLG